MTMYPVVVGLPRTRGPWRCRILDGLGLGVADVAGTVESLPPIALYRAFGNLAAMVSRFSGNVEADFLVELAGERCRDLGNRQLYGTFISGASSSLGIYPLSARRVRAPRMVKASR